ncbi:hypothetical protein NDU88_003397, partial [Pleurodeles waltl]
VGCVDLHWSVATLVTALHQPWHISAVLCLLQKIPPSAVIKLPVGLWRIPLRQ